MNPRLICPKCNGPKHHAATQCMRCKQSSIPTFSERFWNKVNKDGPIPTHAPHLGPCWVWTASNNGNGYGVIGLGKQNAYVHRISYEWQYGPIPLMYEIDHICENRSCVNPTHLQLATHQQNIARSASPPAKNTKKTHCPKGHAYTPENTYRQKKGGRYCRACAIERMRVYDQTRRRKKERLLSLPLSG